MAKANKRPVDGPPQGKAALLAGSTKAPASGPAAKKQKLDDKASVKPGAQRTVDARFTLTPDFLDSDGEDAAPGAKPAGHAKQRPISHLKEAKQQQQSGAWRAAATAAKGRGNAEPSSDEGALDADDDHHSGQLGTEESDDIAMGTGTGTGSSGDEEDDSSGGGTGDLDEGSGGSGDGDEEADPDGGQGRGQQDKGEKSLAGSTGRHASMGGVKKVLSRKRLEEIKEAADRRGIVYISRIPPHMKPHKLRQLLEPHGALGRVYCAPEDPAMRRARKKKGGNSGKNFTEGWVEFEDKRRAKRAALALNGQPMGGSKRSAYHYDLWNIKYLPKFKWDALTEEINYQRAVREQRLVAEISAAKRERDFYLSRVDKAKAIEAIKERKAKKEATGQQQAGAEAGAGAEATQAAAKRQEVLAGDKAEGGGGKEGAAGGGGAKRFERHFGQRRAKADPVNDDRAPVLASDVLGLLGGGKGGR